MKKLFLFMLALLTLGFAAAPVSAQNTLTVADGTTTNSYVPIYGYWADVDQHNQVIYPESLLGDMLNGSISSMTFYLNGNPTWGNSYVASLGITQNEYFSSSTHDGATLTQVCTGTISVSNNQLTFTFDSPYNYVGGNLLFDLVLTGSSYTAGDFYGVSSTGASIYQYSYGTNTQNFMPKTTFIYTGGALCKTPSNLVVSNITTTSADLAWHGDVNASSYNVQYMLSSETDWTNATTVTVTGDTTTTLSGLQPSSSYKVRVQVECSDNTQTVWSSVKTFMTSCDALTITETSPWFEGFEAYQGSGEQPFQCWATPVTATGGGPFVYCGYSASCHNSQNSAELKGANNMLVLPEFTNDVHDLRLSFWATAVTPSNGTLEIGVLPDMDDLTSFEVLGLAGTPSSRNGVGNYMGPFDFNGIQATSGRIALRYSSSGTGNSWNLDDFTVELSPTCTSPVKTSVTSTGVDGHNATISWVDNDATHNSWTLYYKMSTETDNDWQPVTASDTFYTLTGLTPETTYNVYVVTNCNGVPSDDATLTHNFTTLVACPAPTAVTASPVYINEATITWNSTSTVFNIEYGETGFTQGTGTTQTVYDNTVTLNNLNAATSYTVYVQADCSGDNDGLSQWASVQFTTLPSCPAPTQIHANNLTTTSAYLEWTPGYQESEWEVKCGLQGFNPDTVVGDIVTGMPFLSLQNLNANTRYDVYVRSICSSSDSSAWSTLYYFLTPCAPASLPYTENFDSYPSWYSPDCWRKFENGNSGGYVSFGAYIYNEQAYSGDKALKFVAGSSSTGYALLRLPDFDTQDITELQVKFMAKKSSGSRPLVVGVTSDFNSIDSIYVLGTFSDLSNDYAEKIVSLESYPDTHGYIVIGLPKGYSSSSTVYVDDLTVEVRPNCMYPTNFAVTAVGETSVTLSWTELGTADTWNVQYGPMGFNVGDGTTETVTDSTTYTVESLSVSTAYDFYVQSDCSVIGSQWVGPLTVVTSQHNMGITGSDTITTCGMAIYDNGGANGDYSTDCNSTLVVIPATEGSGMSISGTVNTYNGSSYYAGVLTIYAGIGTSGDVLGTYSGNTTVNIAYAGPVTLNFTSGSYYSGAGFELIAQCTECFPPANITISDISMTGATVSWSGAASEYSVLATSAMDTVYATTTDTSYTFTTLTPSTHYTVRVRSLCGGDSSLASTPVTFNSACDQITVTESTPWFENFEGYSNHNFVCWETPTTYTANNGTFPMVYCGYAQSCHSGANSAELKGPELLLVLPDFSNDIHDLRLSFWATATSTSTGHVEVGVITDIMDPTTFEVVIADAGTPGPRGNQDGVSGNGNFMGPFDFNGAQATSGRIALRYTDASASTTPGQSAQSWNLDDFTVSLTPNCPSPVKTSVQASNIDGHNATITFVDNDPDHNSWTVYYKPTADSVWNQVVTSTQSADLTNLDPQTAYDVYVVTNCATPDLEEDATLTIHFTTTVACPAPQNLAVSNIGMTSATLNWFSNADGYTIEYGETGFTVGNGTIVNTTSNTYDLTGLTSGTSYTVYVTADCGVDGTSQVATLNFNTSLCDVVDQCVYTFNLLDSYGDGWNGGSITVKQNNIPVATFGLTSGSSATEAVSLCHGMSTTVEWTAGNFAYEASFTIVGPDNAELYTSPGMDQYSTYTFMPNCSGCAMPTALTVSNISMTSATVSWTGTADSYTVEYGLAGFSPGTGTTSTTTNTTLDLTNLTAATSYTVYVTSVCGTDESSSATANFATTICDASNQCNYTFTLTDGLGDGWNNASLAVQQNGITVIVLEATHNNYNPSTETVTVPLCDNVSTSLVWTSGAYDDEAGFSIAGPDGTVLFTTAAMDNYTTFTFTTDCGGSGPVITDPTVATNAASAVGQTTATLNATITNPDNVTITAKGFQWKATTGGTYTSVTGTGTGNNFTADLTNLTPNTSYTFKAFITFNGTTVEGSEMTFTTQGGDTPEPCDVPTGLHTTDIQNESVSIAWDANANVNSWNVQYRLENGAWSSGTSTTNSYTITGLTGNKDYEIQVQAVCADSTSDWSASITAHTTNVGIENWLENNVTLFPNPAREYVDIRVDGNVNVTAMEVYDVYGKLINTVNVIDNPTRINVNGLADGMYFVRVTTEQGVVTKSFLKK